MRKTPCAAVILLRPGRAPPCARRCEPDTASRRHITGALPWPSHATLNGMHGTGGCLTTAARQPGSRHTVQRRCRGTEADGVRSPGSPQNSAQGDPEAGTSGNAPGPECQERGDSPAGEASQPRSVHRPGPGWRRREQGDRRGTERREQAAPNAPPHPDFGAGHAVARAHWQGHEAEVAASAARPRTEPPRSVAGPVLLLVADVLLCALAVVLSCQGNGPERSAQQETHMSAQSADLSITADTVPGRNDALTASPSQAVPATNSPTGRKVPLWATERTRRRRFRHLGRVDRDSFHRIRMTGSERDTPDRRPAGPATARRSPGPRRGVAPHAGGRLRGAG
jgi:hypothetical protein